MLIPVVAPLKVALDASPKRSTIILANSTGQPWTEHGFRSSWRKACAKAGVVGVTFNDLRGTAVTRLAIAECTEAEIATITGHALRDVSSILDAHYPRSRPRRERDPQARKENGFVQLKAQLCRDALCEKLENRFKINWLGD
ncbi:hypothetical protein [Rhodoplanes sp.]|uniref:hypothetical protein n=1 Tax=Rhodoplanes sp. TaxID=1968906 RepID=UPI0025D380E8|nr:hypothetical protein [Rhodoplanes sp.]